MSISRLMQMGAAGNAGGPGAGNPWDISTATYNGSPLNNYYSQAEGDTPSGIFFKPDGTKMYIAADGENGITEYNLSDPWDISTSSFLNFLSTPTRSRNEDVFFKPDGTKMYLIDFTNEDISEYDLSVAWDISTASLVQRLVVSSRDPDTTGIFFKDDGTVAYIVGLTSGYINFYNLSTPWDISTASWAGRFTISVQVFSPESIFFKPDGTRVYVLDLSGSTVNEYNLSTAWSITSASFVQNFSVSGVSTGAHGLFFKPDGTKMYVSDAGQDRTYAFDLSAPWDISSASYEFPTTNYLNVAAQESAPRAVFFKPDGLKMYVMGINGRDVNEYDLSTAWDISSASYLQNFSVAAQETSPHGIFFKPDGLKMYVVGNSGDDVNEYNLSTAWDVSSASYLQNFSVAAQETNPNDIFFKPDGLKMYIIGSSGDDVNEYNLSIAWDVSTSSFLQNFSVSAQETSPFGLFFKPDGTKMYVIGYSGDDVNEYDLSIAWDISSASYLQNFSVAAQETAPTGVFFKEDGLKMYVVGIIEGVVYSYDL